MFKFHLTKDFLLCEFFKTFQGLKFECGLVANMCCILFNIMQHDEDSDKYPLMEVAKNLICLAEFLQYFRDAFNQPIEITSGFRTLILNKEVGGAEHSKHLIGLAADISFSGYTTYKHPSKFGTPSKVTHMCDFLKDAKNSNRLSELIFHDTYIHLAL